MARSLIIALLLLALTSFSHAQLQKFATVISEKANLRGTPSSKGHIVTTVDQGDALTILKVQGAWYLVETSDYVGWIHGNTIRLGRNQVGTPVGSSSRDSIRRTPSVRKPAKVAQPKIDTIRPMSGTVMATGSTRTGLGELSIYNGTNNDAIVKFIDYYLDRTYRNVYIQADSSATIRGIGVGKYELLFSLGNDYAPSLNKFLRNARYSKFDSLLSFEETETRIGNTIRTNYDTYSLTLNKVADGNARTSTIDESEFEKY